jgi:hypothetical protein
VLILLYVVVIAYCVVDARPAVAVAVVLSVYPVEALGTWLTFGRFMFDPVVPVLLVTLCVAAWLGARRQSRLHPGGLTA